MQGLERLHARLHFQGCFSTTDDRQKDDGTSGCVSIFWAEGGMGGGRVGSGGV